MLAAGGVATALLTAGLGSGGSADATSTSTSTTAVTTDPAVLLVGHPGTTIDGVAPQYTSVQAAVCAAKPGDWILVAPGDYKERGYADGVPGYAACPGYRPPLGAGGGPAPAGVLVETPDIWIRGLGTPSDPTVIDGTRPGTPMCSSARSAQELTSTGLSGIEVYDTSGTWIENIEACNYLTNANSVGGNEIWWNGGQGTGTPGIHSYYGNYLLGTSTYSQGTSAPRGEYGIYADNVDNAAAPAVPNLIDHSFASNMGDAAFYIGGCPNCATVLDHADGTHSALGYSGTNSGGDLTIEHSTFSGNKTGFTSNSQDNTDLPSPQIGLCPGGKKPTDGQPGPFPNGGCTVLETSTISGNNDPTVPGGGGGGLASGAPVGTGVVLAGTRYYTLYHDTVAHNGAWGVVVTDLPDQEQPPANAKPPCQGGLVYLPVPANPGEDTCYYQAVGNAVLDNAFAANGSYHNLTNGDIALTTLVSNPGNCFVGNTDPAGLTTDPPLMQGLLAPLYRSCTTPNAGDMTLGAAELLCATQLVVPCPALPGATYPRPVAAPTSVYDPPPWTADPAGVAQATMPNPCRGVPANPWCPTRTG